MHASTRRYLLFDERYSVKCYEITSTNLLPKLDLGTTYSAVKNYRLTYSKWYVYSFSTMLDFQGKQGLQKGIHSSALYLTRKLNLSTVPMNFRKKKFFEIGLFFLVKNYRLNYVIFAFSDHDEFSFYWKSCIKIENLALSIFIKKSFKNSFSFEFQMRYYWPSQNGLKSTPKFNILVMAFQI